MANLVESMNKAIECNNIGVDLLRAGRLDEAIETFKGAAEVMYPVSRVLQLSQAYVFRPTQPIQVDVRESEILKKARSRLSSLCQSAASSSKLGCINCFIYVDPKKIEPMVCDPASCTLESATVVYNMGLTYHLQGSAACLQKALCLFDMAFDLVSSADSYASSSEIAMAALNNAGEIHHAVGHYQLSRQYLNTLSAFILRLPNSECKKTRWERHQFLFECYASARTTVCRSCIRTSICPIGIRCEFDIYIVLFILSLRPSGWLFDENVWGKFDKDFGFVNDVKDRIILKNIRIVEGSDDGCNQTMRAYATNA